VRLENGSIQRSDFMMYGKVFKSMFDGSLYGAGCNVIAVWTYALVNATGGHVELNPTKLQHTLGATPEEIQEAMDVLTKADPESRNGDNEGKRLVSAGKFQYFIPNWQYYQAMRNEEERREYNRLKKQDERLRKRLDQMPPKSKPLPGENAYVKAEREGNVELADRIAEGGKV
jgi:hypothetical protein